MNIPNGFKLVPVEPTDEMIMAFITKRAIGLSDEYPGVRFGGNYQAMLEAAPTPPQPIYDMSTELSKFIEFASDKAWFNPVLKDADDVKMQFQEEFTDAIWIGWLACAKSSAKAGEVDHE